MSVTFTMRQLLDAGVHFGHVTRRWNPKMKPFIFGIRSKIHIIDLDQTCVYLDQALKAIRDNVSAGGRILFIGTKRQAQQPIKEAAIKCGQYYVDHRWLGGTLTNWKTITKSINKLKQINKQLEEKQIGLTKKELLKLTQQRDKLERALGGISGMAGMPDMLFVIDVNKEATAIAEAKKLSIPVVGIVDTNGFVENITYPVPGNDDALRAIKLYCNLVTEAVIEGIAESVKRTEIDIGAMEKTENIPEKAEKKPNQNRVKNPIEKPAEKLQPETPVSQAEEKPAEKLQPETPASQAEEKPAEKLQPEAPVSQAEEKPAEKLQPETPVSQAEEKPDEKLQPETPVSQAEEKLAENPQLEIPASQAEEKTTKEPALETQEKTEESI